MLPTPDTSHVPFTHVYEPAEDSYLLLDTLSSPAETQFLTCRFSTTPAPLVLEIGPGSGIVISFVHAHAQTLFGTRAVLAAAVDANPFACAATAQTVRVAEQAEGQDGGTDEGAKKKAEHGCFVDVVVGDLASPWREGIADVLIFNPPYVPTDELPSAPGDSFCRDDAGQTVPPSSPTAGAAASGGRLSFDDESYLLALSYAGGRDGMETTDRVVGALPNMLSRRGCAYILLCARNRPEQVKARIRLLGPGEAAGNGTWKAETVGESGAKAGWERLVIVRAWREWAE